MLAAEITETEPALVVIEEPSRPLTEILVDLFDLDAGSFTAGVLGRVIEPLLQIVIIVTLAWVAVMLLRRLARRLMNRLKAREAAGPPALGTVTRRNQRIDALSAVTHSVIGLAVWSVAVLTVLGATIGLNVAPLLAGAGILGVALGFGAQNVVRDVLSGMFMLIEDQYGVGDVINVGEAVGVVEGVSLRTTRLRDVTGTLWHVPNGEIRRVGNMSQEWSRALLDIGVAYGSDIDRAAEVIQAVADEMATEETYETLFLADPEIWGVESLTDDAVLIRLVVKTRPGEQWAISRELRRRIKLSFDREGIEIPFPQQTVWLRRDAGLAPSDLSVDPSAPSAATGKGAAEEGATATSDGQTQAPEDEDPVPATD
ncbi:mechanosensitive ion channel family protein [soil metagenome]